MKKTKTPTLVYFNIIEQYIRPIFSMLTHAAVPGDVPAQWFTQNTTLQVIANISLIYIFYNYKKVLGIFLETFQHIQVNILKYINKYKGTNRTDYFCWLNEICSNSSVTALIYLKTTLMQKDFWILYRYYKKWKYSFSDLYMCQ